MASAQKVSSEDIGYWYLRLNGFLILRNFLVHGDRRGQIRTDIDLLGARFRYRREHLAQPMRDDDWVEREDATIVVFTEVKNGARDFNDSWRNPRLKMMESFLALTGAVADDSYEEIATSLYANGVWRSKNRLVVTTLLINHDPSKIQKVSWPDAPHIQLTDALSFIFDRFQQYRNIKADHCQWEPSGHSIWNYFERYQGKKNSFVSALTEDAT